MHAVLSAREIRGIDLGILEGLKQAITSGVLDGKVNATRQFIRRTAFAVDPLSAVSYN